VSTPGAGTFPGLTLSLANGSTPGAGTFPGLTLSLANGSTPGAGTFPGLTLSLDSRPRLERRGLASRDEPSARHSPAVFYILGRVLRKWTAATRPGRCWRTGQDAAAGLPTGFAVPVLETGSPGLTRPGPRPLSANGSGRGGGLQSPELPAECDAEFRDMRKIHGTQSLFKRKGLCPEFSVSCPRNSQKYSGRGICWRTTLNRRFRRATVLIRSPAPNPDL